MLTNAHKQKRVEWAHRHLNDDWKKMLFSDETEFQLFRNTVECWYKGERPVRPMPKDRTKIFVWCRANTRGRAERILTLGFSLFPTRSLITSTSVNPLLTIGDLYAGFKRSRF